MAPLVAIADKFRTAKITFHDFYRPILYHALGAIMPGPDVRNLLESVAIASLRGALRLPVHDGRLFNLADGGQGCVMDAAGWCKVHVFRQAVFRGVPYRTLTLASAEGVLDNFQDFFPGATVQDVIDFFSGANRYAGKR